MNNDDNNEKEKEQDNKKKQKKEKEEKRCILVCLYKSHDGIASFALHGWRETRLEHVSHYGI